MAQKLHVSCLSGKPRLHTSRLAHRKPCTYAGTMKPKDHIKETGQRLKSARNAAGKTQEDAAEYLEVETGEPCRASRISNWEQGTRLISPVALQILCNLYSVSPSAIYGFDDAPKDADEIDLLHKYRTTDDRGRRAIHGIAEAQPGYSSPTDSAKISHT